MRDVATLNIRNVPEEVVETLKARAAARGDSLNGEIVRTLTEVAGRRTVDDILASIDAIQDRLPPMSMSWDEFMEELNREQDERAEHIWREATRPRDVT